MGGATFAAVHDYKSALCGRVYLEAFLFIGGPAVASPLCLTKDGLLDRIFAGTPQYYNGVTAKATFSFLRASLLCPSSLPVPFESAALCRIFFFFFLERWRCSIRLQNRLRSNCSTYRVFLRKDAPRIAGRSLRVGRIGTGTWPTYTTERKVKWRYVSSFSVLVPRKRQFKNVQ